MAPWNPEKSQYVLIRISVIICCLVLRSFFVCFFDWFLVNFDIAFGQEEQDGKQICFFFWIFIFFFREELAKVLVDGWILVA